MSYFLTIVGLVFIIAAATAPETSSQSSVIFFSIMGLVFFVKGLTKG